MYVEKMLIIKIKKIMKFVGKFKLDMDLVF